MAKAERKDLTWKERLLFAVSGLLIAAYGYGQLLRGKPIYTNWRGQNVTAWFVIVVGAFFLLFAIFPWSRIHFLWNTDDSKRRR